MPEVQGPPEVTREVLSRLDTLSAKLASVSSLLEARFAQAQYTARNLQLPSNATEPFPLPKGTGGLILVPPPNQDLAGLAVEVGGMSFTFAVGSVTPAFIACPGVSTSATLTNTTAATIPLRLITVGPEYAAMYTQTFGISITGSRGSGQTVPLYVALSGSNAPYTDRSGTIAAGGTSQVLAAANTARVKLFVQNPASATEGLWINFGIAAVIGQPSIEIPPGSSFSMSPLDIELESVNIIAATTGHSFTAKEGS